jgi:hypothetical protein
MQVDHHRGRYPWTRYVFELALELDPLQEVVVDRVVRCALRRGQQRRPELGAMLDRVTREHGEKLVEVWMHAELREDDDQAGIERRERGWVALVEHGARGPLLATNGPPAWAQVSRAAA